MARSRNNESDRRSNDRGGRDGRQEKKHSGSRSGFDKKGAPYTNGWNYSRQNGLVSFLATPYSKSKESKSETGRLWLNVMVKVSRKLQKDFIVSGMMDLRSGLVVVQELGIVMNPNAPNGGYCGKFTK